jgi:serine/threonine-protein kinase
MAAEDALPLLEQMAEALDAAHRAGVIHRDFKPSNVMLLDGPAGRRAVITDFGLARPAAPSEGDTATVSGQIIGTLDYMAPELLTGAKANPPSDLYALGLVAYKMVTGELPFESGSPLAAAPASPSPPRALEPATSILHGIAP